MKIEKIKESNAKYLGKEIEYYKEIPSTHKYAKKIASDKKNNGKVIIAEMQTDGIGTNGRKWYTGEGKNIALTIILTPKCNANALEGLTVDIASVLKKTIKELYNVELTIKKPNDLMLNSKKVSGILTEINTCDGKINYLLISIGMNVNEENFEEEIIDISTSLKKEYQKDFSREDIIANFLINLEDILYKYNILLNG